jgi:Ni/Co efflux regulator RcnB
MKSIQKVVALSTVAIVLSSSGSLFAQDHHDDRDHHDNHHYVHHQEWRKGARMNHDDWNRGERVDYRHYHLNAPPRGYEWREVDGNYVLAAVATGLIASVVVASAAH